MTLTRRRLLATATAALACAAGLAAPPSAQAAGVRIYPLGDSITYGATWYVGRPAQLPPQVPWSTVPVDTPGGYRTTLTAALTASGVTHELVGASTANSNAALDRLGQNHHNGHPGYRVDQCANALDGRAGAGGDLGGYWLTGTGGRGPIFPDVTVVHLGTNDIGQRYDPGTTYPGSGGKANLADAAQRATFVTHLATRLQGLVDKIQALRPGSRVVLSTLVPISVAPLDVTVAEYNARIAAIATAERAGGARVVLADPWSVMAAATPAGIVTVPGMLSPDNVHPTPAGFAVMGAVYRDGVVAALALP